jgi:hypothetical protein
MGGFARSHRKARALGPADREIGGGSRPSGGANTHPGHPPRNGDPMKGRRPYEGFRAIRPGGPETTRRDSPRETLPHAVPVTPCSPPSDGRARRAARAGACPYPLAWRPSRGARRRLPLPHLASSDGRYVRFAYATPGARNPKNPQKMATWHIRNSPCGRGHCPPFPVAFRVSTENFHI